MSKRDPRKRDYKKVHHCPVSHEKQSLDIRRQYQDTHNEISDHPSLNQVSYRVDENGFHLVNLMFNTLDMANRLIFRIKESKTQLFLLMLCLLFLMIIIL